MAIKFYVSFIDADGQWRQTTVWVDCPTEVRDVLKVMEPGFQRLNEIVKA